jgi:LacI family transcriptional regulator
VKKSKPKESPTKTVRGKRDKSAEHNITIRDVARRAVVSVATVSRVLNEPARVREKTRARVEKAMSELDFVPNLLASSLAKNRTECIGLIIPNLGPVFAPLVNEIEHVIRAEGSYLVVVTGKIQPDDVAGAVQFLQQRRCDALIVFPGAMNNTQITTLLDEQRNIVILHHAVPDHMERCVLVDNSAGSRIATRYLIDCGHREIAVITGPDDNQESNERLAAFMQTMKDAGLAVDPKLVVPGDFDPVSGERGIAQLLSCGQRFSALFCFSDEMAAGAISYLRAAGVNLPEDLSIVGFDDVLYCSQIYPRLTTVHQPVIEIGRIAAQRALALSSNRDMPQGSTVLQPRLVVRDSVVPLRAATNAPARHV